MSVLFPTLSPVLGTSLVFSKYLLDYIVASKERKHEKRPRFGEEEHEFRFVHVEKNGLVEKSRWWHR